MSSVTVEKSFAGLGLKAATLQSLDAKGYKAPTDVQFETIPKALAGKDLVVQSRTGTGKTAAFGIPIVEKVDLAKAEPQAVVLAPTRELAIQVAQEVTELGRAGRVKVEAIYGGDSHGPPARRHQGGAQVIVGHARPRARPPAPGHAEVRRACACWCSTKPTACSTWASRWRWARSWSTCRRSGRRCCSRRRCRSSIRGLIYHYLTEPEWVLLSEDQIYVKEVEHLYVPDPTPAQGGDARQAPRVREAGRLDDLLQHQGGDAPRLDVPRRHAATAPPCSRRTCRRRSASR